MALFDTGTHINHQVDNAYTDSSNAYDLAMKNASLQGGWDDLLKQNNVNDLYGKMSAGMEQGNTKVAEAYTTDWGQPDNTMQDYIAGNGWKNVYMNPKLDFAMEAQKRQMQGAAGFGLQSGYADQNNRYAMNKMAADEWQRSMEAAMKGRESDINADLTRSAGLVNQGKTTADIYQNQYGTGLDLMADKYNADAQVAANKFDAANQHAMNKANISMNTWL